MDVLPRAGDALAQPTRARLFALLGELRRPATTEELAALLQLHPNGVRVHLDRLREAGLVERDRERRPRGRPRDRGTVSPTARPGGDRPTDYSGLARWLVRAMTLADLDAGEVEAAGERIGRDLVPDDAPGTPPEQMDAVLAALGFAPTREAGPDGTLTWCLGNCPYRDVVRERQPLVCALHRGMTRGLLETLDPEATLSAFVVRDPDEAGCRIEVRGPMAASASTSEP